MRKKILTGACALGFLFSGAYVVSENVNQAELTDLVLENVDAYAGDWNNWKDWIDQGFTMDERDLPVIERRTVKIGNVTIEEEKVVITCPYGDKNCTPTH